MADGTADRAGRRRAYAPALASALAAAGFAALLPAVAGGAAPELALPWLPALGASFAFRVDGLALGFALLVTGIGALILAYTASYFAHHPHRGRLLTLLGLFELAMLGLVLADDALTLFLFWEGTTITSFLLIGFDGHKPEARAKALQALIVTGLGGVALLAGLLILGRAAGTFRLSEMAAAAPEFRDAAAYLPVFLLVTLGCFAKSAQVPFHFWLPNAMAAPTPVSAYLHSATMVKAGVYLLARFAPVLGDTVLWTWTLSLAGAATMLLGAVWSLRQSDLKLALAHTTVMGLGTVTLFLGLGSEAATVGAMAFLMVHAFYKAALFLVVGILDKKAGSREADALGGLGRAMPLTFLVALLAGLSMAGFPPFFGFIAKEALFEGALTGGFWADPRGLMAALAVALASAMMVAIAGAVALAPFTGALRSPKAEPGDPPFAMAMGPALLAALGLACGLAPGLIDATLVGPMAASALGRPVDVHFALWHGVGAPLILSFVVFGLGAILYVARDGVRAALIHAETDGAAGFRALGGARRLALPRAEGGYDAALAGLARGAAAVGTGLQSGLASHYLRAGFATFAALALAGLALGGRLPLFASSPPPVLFLGAAALMAAATAVLPFTTRRFLKITALGVVGVGVALIFAIYGAIDVAITQLMVETLVVVIIAVAILKLPRIVTLDTPEAARRRRRDAVVAAAFGAAFALSLAAVLEGELDRRVTAYYEQASATLAFGRNIVNVILVDFRALDTLGEIAVIAVAGVAAMALLAARVRPLEDRDR
jgi:multicomponent Na+:H+ antiporter subunit A